MALDSRALLFLLLVLVVAAAGLLLFPSARETEKQIFTLTSDKQTYQVNESITLRGQSTCWRETTLLINGKEWAKLAEKNWQSTLTLPGGDYQIEARADADCSAKIQLEVIAPECENGQKRDCLLDDGCLGEYVCHLGEWGTCLAKSRVCIPGNRIGCMVDDCHFGYATCGPCGTYGPCLMP